MEDKLQQLEECLRAMLPEQYQDCYEDVQAVSMGSAGLVYNSEGRVAWNKIWATFCDLAMAGGPPHKGKLLESGNTDEISAQPEAYDAVVDEICRGLRLAADLPAERSSLAGWVQVDCESHAMAGWLARAIVMENVSAAVDGAVLRLPAGPGFRIEKEIKNVITSAAKTCHYWRDHMDSDQHRDIARRLTLMNAMAPLLQPGLAGSTELLGSIAESVRRASCLRRSLHAYPTWIGFECGGVRAAVWMLRALVTFNTLARREETTLFVPVNPTLDRDGERAARAVIEVAKFARFRGVLQPA